MSIKVSSEQLVHATPEQVYFAFTRAISLHEWLCDYATVAPRPGGRMYLWWHGDFYSAGEFIALEENKSIKFKWFSRSDPAPSEVTVTIIPKGSQTLVRLDHAVPDGDEWEKRAIAFKQEWDSTLPNLVSVLETGMDKRIFDRPMLGINISDFNPEIARKMGVPVHEGIRLDDVRPGMGAHAAGLCKDDVIVEMNGQPVTNDFGTFISALAGKKGGDSVPVVYYRGSTKHTITMELSKRPTPDIPWAAKELARQLRETYDQSIGRLADCLQGASESDAGFEPAPGEWSAKQVLAHLIQTERNTLSNLDDAVGGYERLSDDWGGNIPSHINATVSAYGTVQGLLDDLKRLAVEMIAFVAELPASYVERKSSYFIYASQLLELGSHTTSHVEQIKAALSSARQISGKD
jgi:uncharacterized protein YndB with AHSA1/START domain